jgi:hypothetical protein
MLSPVSQGLYGKAGNSRENLSEYNLSSLQTFIFAAKSLLKNLPLPTSLRESLG